MLRVVILWCGLWTLLHAEALAQTFSFEIEERVLLHEVEGIFLRTISDITREDTLLWITDTEGPGVYLFTLSGLPIQDIGGKGQGPQEYQRPQQIRIYGDTVWIWDADLLRFFRVRKSTRQAIAPLGGFGLACKDFLLVSPDTLIFSHAQRSKGFVSLYRVSTASYVRFLGEGSYEDVLLSMHNRSLHLAYIRPWVFFTRPSSNELFRWNVHSDEITRVALNVPDFKVETYEGPEVPAITPEALRFILREDINRGAWRMGEYVMVFLETGAHAYASTYPIQATSWGTKAYHFVFLEPERLQPFEVITWDTDFLERHRIGGYAGWDPETQTLYFGYWDPGAEDTGQQHVIPVRFTKKGGDH